MPYEQYLPMFMSVGSGLVSFLYMGVHKERHFVSETSIKTNLMNLLVSLVGVIFSQFWLYLFLTGFSILGIFLVRDSYGLEHPYAILFGGNTMGGLAIWLGLESQHVIENVITSVYTFAGHTIQFDPFFVFYEGLTIVIICNVTAYITRHI